MAELEVVVVEPTDMVDRRNEVERTIRGLLPSVISSLGRAVVAIIAGIHDRPLE